MLLAAALAVLTDQAALLRCVLELHVAPIDAPIDIIQQQPVQLTTGVG
jgi:hypothetical protein